jgi:hypothetical protein
MDHKVESNSELNIKEDRSQSTILLRKRGSFLLRVAKPEIVLDAQCEELGRSW